MSKLRELKISNDRFTIRTSTIGRYLNDIEKTAPLSPEEETRIAKLVKMGDRNAEVKLITSNLRFVFSVAKQYSMDPEILAELISVGNIGLIESARTFDPTRGFKFISHAVWGIRKEILKYLQDSDVIRIPGNQKQQLRHSNRIENILLNKLEREPTIDEISEYFISEGRTLDVKNLLKTRLLGNHPIPFEYDDSGDYKQPSEYLSSDDFADSQIMQSETKKLSADLLNLLTDLEKEVVVKHLGLINNIPYNFSTIGQEIGKTAESARLIYNKAIRKMKSGARNLPKTPRRKITYALN